MKKIYFMFICLFLMIGLSNKSYADNFCLNDSVYVFHKGNTYAEIKIQNITASLIDKNYDYNIYIKFLALNENPEEYEFFCVNSEENSILCVNSFNKDLKLILKDNKILSFDSSVNKSILFNGCYKSNFE